MVDRSIERRSDVVNARGVSGIYGRIVDRIKIGIALWNLEGGV